MAKRLFDIVSSAGALLVLSPALLLVMMILRCTGEGEVFYRQERVGRGGKTFQILKFATMLKNSPNLPGGDITAGEDPRILPLGHVLRKTKLNELPQLINVFLGDMSVIGPRPLTPRVAALFPDYYWKRIGDLRPGLSGLGSIVFRNEEALLKGADDRHAFYQNVIVPYKMSLEEWYTEHGTFFVDMKLICLTLMAVLFPDFDIGNRFSNLPLPPDTLAAHMKTAA